MQKQKIELIDQKITNKYNLICYKQNFWSGNIFMGRQMKNY